MSKRETWVDIAKGLGIMAVVFGHSGNAYSPFLFWFHMPLFFILSGYTFKTVNNINELKTWFIKKAPRLLIPYFSFGSLIILIVNTERAISNKFSLVELIKDIIKLFYDGQLLSGYFAVFWFITCLFTTQILFMLITLLFKKSKNQIAVLIVLYILAHIESKFFPTISLQMPWNIDVSLIAVVYFSIGFYLKYYKYVLFRKIPIVLVFSLSLILILGKVLAIYTYKLDMKYHIYSNPLLDLLIPVTLSFAIFIISNWLSVTPKSNFLSYLGMTTLPIMYLHFPVNNIASIFIYNYNWLYFTILGLVIPIIINSIIQRNSLLKLLFLGSRGKSIGYIVQQHKIHTN